MFHCKHSQSFKQLLLVVLAIIVLLPACAPISTKQVSSEVEDRPQSNADFLFINGDFENALLQYQLTYESTFSSAEKNTALYGMACTQLMLATSDSQFIEAIRNLNKWDAHKGSVPFTENHHLLILALKQQADLLQQKNTDSKQHEINKNTLISSQKNQIAEMASIVQKLQKQLEELEAIDEIFQGKRKPI